MVESFKHSETVEMESMRALRAKNMEKHRQEDSADIKYCLCRKGPSGFMFQCELCKDWFHGKSQWIAFVSRKLMLKVLLLSNE